MNCLSSLAQEVLRNYARTLDGGQNELAAELDVHHVTLSRWLNGNLGCARKDELEEMARQKLIMNPEWGTDVKAQLMQKAMTRLTCTPQQARIIAEVLAT